jgi:hypothetical protein
MPVSRLCGMMSRYEERPRPPAGGVAANNAPIVEGRSGEIGRRVGESDRGNGFCSFSGATFLQTIAIDCFLF